MIRKNLIFWGLLSVTLFVNSCNKETLSSSNITPAVSNSNLTVVSPTENGQINKSKYSYIFASCAPWDGPAIEIMLFDKPQECPKFKAPYFRIAIWKELKEVLGKELVFPTDQLGVIAKTIEEDNIVSVKNGTVKIKEGNFDSDVVFELDATFSNGEKINGTFKAKWCKMNALCG